MLIGLQYVFMSSCLSKVRQIQKIDDDDFIKETYLCLTYLLVLSRRISTFYDVI